MIAIISMYDCGFLFAVYIILREDYSDNSKLLLSITAKEEKDEQIQLER